MSKRQYGKIPGTNQPSNTFWNTVKSSRKSKKAKASGSSHVPFHRKEQTYKTKSGQKYYSQLSQEEEYKVLAARANKRLQRIEKYAQRDEYKGIENAAYKRALHDIKSLRGEKSKRFSREMPTDPNEYNAAMNFMLRFLGADTSTIQPGIGTAGANISRYEEMARKFNEKFTKKQGGAEVTWKDIAAWYSSYNGKRMKKLFKSSEAVAIALGQFKRLTKDKKYKNMNIKQWQEELEKNPEQITGGDVLAESAMKAMLDNNISPKNLFKKR